MKSLIELNNITYEYNNNKILKNINLKINEGEKIALLGKSGAGKTTLISILNGMKKQTNGDVKIYSKSFNNLDIDDLSPTWYSKDRVKMYPGTFLSYMPRDPIPFIDTELSPCQRVSFARKLRTAAKMIFHPIIARKADAHGDKMSSFYADQAKGYDAVRESMLVSRPDMISAFGPVKEGHTWLDIGGGTGRNLHYLRAEFHHQCRLNHHP